MADVVRFRQVNECGYVVFRLGIENEISDALQRAVRAFGFHLCTLDLRQNSRVHEATVAV